MRGRNGVRGGNRARGWKWSEGREWSEGAGVEQARIQRGGPKFF